MNLYELFDSRFKSQQDRPFIHDPSIGAFSNRDTRRWVLRLAQALHGIGLKPGDRLVAQLDKSPFFFFLYFACLHRGIIFVPVNTRAPAQELARVLADSDPAVIVNSTGAALAEAPGIPVFSLSGNGEGSLPQQHPTQHTDKLDVTFAPAAVGPRHNAVMLYTSGTTGAPKGVLMPHGMIARNAELLRAAWKVGPDDVILHALPVFNSHGLSLAVNGVLLAGGMVRLLQRFDLDAVVQSLPGCTMFSGVPTMYIKLLERNDFDAALCRTMRLFVSSSAAMPEAIAKAFEARTGHRILECYGLTETGTLTSHGFGEKSPPGSVGTALPGVELRIADDRNASLPPGSVGALLARKPEMFSGYWQREAETAECFTGDGFFKTGDLASIDTSGHVRIAGRAKEVIISGGFNLFPREIELALGRLSGIAECSVIGVPHPHLGEAPLALVVGRDSLDEAALLAELRGALAPHKLPRRVVQVETIPRTAAGKIDILKIRDRFRDIFLSYAE